MLVENVFDENTLVEVPIDINKDIEFTVENSRQRAQNTIENNMEAPHKCCYKHQPKYIVVAIVAILLFPLLIFAAIVIGLVILYAKILDRHDINLPMPVLNFLGLFPEVEEVLVDSDPVIPVPSAEERRNMNIETDNMDWEFPINYDVGMYWFTYGNVCSKGRKYFDTSKKTVLYIHG